MSEAASFLDGRVTLHRGDCLAIVRALPDASIDSCVCDPPYALVSIVKRFGKTSQADDTLTSDRSRCGADGYARLAKGFMGKEWDNGAVAFAVEFWREMFRVLKPGGHLIAFGGTRSYHRLACAIEDSGFEIRDQLAWVYGSGFPKSHDVSKGIDKALGHERAKVRIEAERLKNPPNLVGGVDSDGDRPWRVAAIAKGFNEALSDEAACAEAAAWQGWGTALKPAWEPICLARKPLSEKTVAANVLRWGTGAINVDATRVGFAGTEDAAAAAAAGFAASRARGSARQSNSIGKESRDGTNTYDPFALAGRWPANIVHDGSEEVLAAFPESNGQLAAVGPRNGAKSSVNAYGDYGPREQFEPRGDSGSAARFFYSAKADSDDRLGSKHPTVKPVDLMQWLVRLVTPPPRLVCPQCAKLAYENSAKTIGSDSPMRTVRRDVQAARQQTSEPLLQQAVRERGDDAETENLRDLRQEVSADEFGAAMLREAVCLSLDGEAQEKPQAVPNLEEGIQADLYAGSPSIETARRLPIRTSAGDGKGFWPPSDDQRSRPSHQSCQDGQSSRKSSINAEGRPRQTEPSSSKHPDVSSLPRADRDEPTCPHCGSILELKRSVVLDPFSGTGTTGEAAWREGFNAVLIEREAEYQADIARRMALCLAGPDERRRESIKARLGDKPADHGPLFAEPTANSQQPTANSQQKYARGRSKRKFFVALDPIAPSDQSE